MADTKLIFQMNFKSSTATSSFAGGRTESQVKEVDAGIGQMMNYVISNIAFRTTMTQRRLIENQLEAKVAGIAQKELTNMGRKINKMVIGLGSQMKYPQGSLSVEGTPSTTLTPDRREPMTLRSVTGDWRDRTESYLRRKSRKFGHRRWFLNTGQLRDVLKNPQTYTGAFGPVRVRWIPEPQANQTVTNTRFSNFARGRGSGRSYKFTTGRVEMSILGRITRQMLADPGQPALNSKFTGLFDMFDEKSELKLLGRYNPRVVVEPFLTFYINRQIPNRIMGEIERSLASTRTSATTRV